MVEASIWVAGGLVLAETFTCWANAVRLPSELFDRLGGVLLGLGAYINRACVFGAIARFGSGEWAYVATPVGIYVGA
jgi:toxin CptA